MEGTAQINSEQIKREEEKQDELHRVGFVDFVKAAKEMVILAKNSQEKMPMGGLVALAGLMAGFPEKVNAKTLMDSQSLRVFVEVIDVGMDMNDYLDMGGNMRKREGRINKRFKDRSGPEKTWSVLGEYDDIFKKWRGALRRIGFLRSESMAHEQPAGEVEMIEKNLKDRALSDQDKEVIRSYMIGVLRINHLMDAEEKDSWNLEKITRYKELENGLSMLCTAALILKGGETERLRLNLKSDMSLDDIAGEMDWLLENNPKNDTEKRLCALFSVVMMTQFVDDWHDLETDNKLGLYTLATGLIEASYNNKERALKLRETKIKEYYERGKDVGVTWLGFEGAKAAFDVAKSLMYLSPKNLGGRREQMNIKTTS